MRAIVLTLVLLGGCTTTPAPTEGTVALGQTAYVGGPPVTPLEVVEDSRCPARVQCVWAGRVVVRVRVGEGSAARVHDLELGKPAPHADGMLTLVAVTPARSGNEPIAEREYRFRFDFDGGL